MQTHIQRGIQKHNLIALKRDADAYSMGDTKTAIDYSSKFKTNTGLHAMRNTWTELHYHSHFKTDTGLYSPCGIQVETRATVVNSRVTAKTWQLKFKESF